MNTNKADLTAPVPTKLNTRGSIFTQGPWRCIEVEFGDYQTGSVAFVVSSGGGEMVGCVGNCNLISAAPDLLTALVEIVSVQEGGYERARAAIAKATGAAA